MAVVHTRKPGAYRDMEARRAYCRAWMAARRARACTKSGEAAGRKKETVAAHPQKSNRAIAAETGVAFKTVARAQASGGPNDTPEKTIGLDGKSYPEGRPKIRIPNNWAPGDIKGTSGAISNRAENALSAFGTAEPVRMTFVCIGPRRP